MTTTDKLAEALRLGEEFANECINMHITAYGESWPRQNRRLAAMREELHLIQDARAALAATPAAASEQQGDKWGAFGYLRKTNSKDNPPHGWAFHFAGRPGDVAVWTTQAPPQVLAATPAPVSALVPLTPSDREALRQRVMAEMDKRMPTITKKFHDWNGWPGTWTFADVAVSALQDHLIAHGIGQGKESA